MLHSSEISLVIPLSIFFFYEADKTMLYKTKQTKSGFGLTFYEQSVLFGVQSINRTAGSSNQMSCGRNQEAHRGFVDGVLEEHFSISLHHKQLVKAKKKKKNKTTGPKEWKIVILYVL